MFYEIRHAMISSFRKIFVKYLFELSTTRATGFADGSYSCIMIV